MPSGEIYKSGRVRQLSYLRRVYAHVQWCTRFTKSEIVEKGYTLVDSGARLLMRKEGKGNQRFIGESY